MHAFSRSQLVSALRRGVGYFRVFFLTALLFVHSASIAFAQNAPAEEKSKAYNVQWGIVILFVFLGMLIMFKPSRREGKVKREKTDKKKGPPKNH